MPQSHACMLAHIIFSTKDRRPILFAEVRGELEAYMVGVLSSLKCPSVMIRSVEDHVHGLIFLARDLSVSEAVAKLKANSSRWLKSQSPKLTDFAWQRGDGAFSVSKSNLEAVKSYLEKQEEHHRKVSFMDEFINFLEKHGIEFDERYLWD